MDNEEVNHMKEMTDRIVKLELKVDALLVLFERTTGAWMLLKLIGGSIAGLVALWAFFTDHFKFH